MAKTAARRQGPSSSKNRGRPQSKRKISRPKSWYRRAGMGTWIVIGAGIATIALFALLQRDTAMPEGAQELPVVGGDLHSFVVDPEDPNRLFIGSHQGVSVSTNGGDTWEAIESLNGADAMGWAFSDDAIYVGGHPGLSVSTDGGKTFEIRNDGLPNTDIHALGAGGDELYVASPGAGFLASSDGGETWEVRNAETGGAFMGEILVDPSDPDHLVGPDMQAGAAESTDGGRTWKVLGGLQAAGWVSWNLSNTEELIVSGMGSAARSIDGGKTWNPMEIPDGASIVEIAPDDSGILYAAVHESPNARLWVSTNNGNDWREL